MVISVSVQCNDGLLPDIILLTLCDSIVVVVVVFTLKTVLTSIQYPSISFLLFKAKKRVSVVTS